jgi:DNA repair protein RadD
VRPVLRPYQRACVDALFSWVSAHDGHPLLVVPTGGGKSLIMGTILDEALGNAPGARALILAHRKELIAQNVKAVTSVMPLGQVGIYSAGLNSRDTTSRIIVGGIQSVARRPYDLGAFDLILIDEAHLVPTEDDTLYRQYINAAKTQNTHVRFVGLTATPYRLGHGVLHRGRGALFSEIAYEASVCELIRDGYLCPLISKATLTQLSVAGVATRGGEFVAGALERAVDVEATTAAAVDEMEQLFADRKKWLLFCAGVKHAEHVAEELRIRGISAAAVHGELPKDERAQALNDFKTGRLRALTSMDVLTTGYDEPAIDAIALLRPTKSTGLYVQMVGRGFRLHSSKQNTLVLDFAGNVARHGPVDQITVDEMGERGSGEGAVPTKICPLCRSIEVAGVRLCSVCGYEFPKPEPPPILPTSSTLPILSTEPKPITWDEITSVEYHYHQRDDRTPSLRVEYYYHYKRLAMEWICLAHSGFARTKAEHWWKRRTHLPVPETIDEALAIAEDDSLLEPTEIATQPDGKWLRVVDYKLPDLADKPSLPRACWSCGFWSDVKRCCRKWDAEPPADVQATGCEAWTETEEVPF